MSTAFDKRAYDVGYKRRQSAERRDIIVPPCGSPDRRAELEASTVDWLRYYFGDECASPFWYEFTSQQRDMIDAIGHAIAVGGDQAIAASRGEGKSTLCWRTLLKHVLCGKVEFAVLFAASGTMATNIIGNLKMDIESAGRLAIDYPEVCEPIAALEGIPQRAKSQTVSGRRHDNGDEYEQAESKFTWCGNEIILPAVPGSPAAGAIIATRGLDAAVRGLNQRGKRPTVAIIDDPDTEESSRSELQAGKLEDRIDKGIDTGAIVRREEVPIRFGPRLRDTVTRTMVAVLDASAAACRAVLEDLPTRLAAARPQGPGHKWTTPSFGQYLRILRNHRRLRDER